MSEKRPAVLDQGKRLAEIVDVLRRNELTKGMTPEKLCAILEELGPTYIKLGQIFSMRADFLPQAYCDALARLRTDVEPMPWEQVKRIIETAYGKPLGEVFADFDPKALGSASIAQAHAATLITGERVAVKVQREGIRDTMSQDIRLLKKAAELVKYTPAKGLLDFNRVLDEMWMVSQQEMDFLCEARNLETFRRNNADVPYVTAPALYKQYTTANLLVMEYVDGLSVSDRDGLTAAGLDPDDLGAKLAENYAKQVTEDGFFHADPHPGNLRIREDGQIVFLDMGMMGTLREQDRRAIAKALSGIARNEVQPCVEAILTLGVFAETPDRRQLYRDCEAMIDRYAGMKLGEMDLSQLMTDALEVMKANHIGMPASLTMLARGMATLEGVVRDLAPSCNVAKVAADYVTQTFLRDFDWKGQLIRDGRAVYNSGTKALDIPALVSDTLRAGLKGDASVGVEHRFGKETRRDVRRGVTRVCAALLCSALLLAAALGDHTSPVLAGMSLRELLCVGGALPLIWVIFFRDRER